MQLFATSSNIKLATFACALNTLRVLLPWNTDALKTGGHITNAARVGSRVHRVAVVCVTPGEGSNGEQNKRSYSQGLIMTGVAPIVMGISAIPRHGFVIGAAITVPGGNFHPMVQVGYYSCRTLARGHVTWRSWIYIIHRCNFFKL